jgi:hypothetical protein
MMHTMRRAMRFSLACAGLASFAAVLNAQTPTVQAPAWQTYSYSAEGFSVSFPAQPELSKQSVPTAAGTFELRAYNVTVGPSALYVGVCDYGAAANGHDPQAMLNGAENGALSNTQAHLIGSSKITLGAYPGLAFDAENQTLHFTARIYVVGSTLYQTLTASPIGQPYADTVRFLDSFQFIARAAP